MTKKLRVAVFALLGALGLGVVAPTAAQAGSSGRRNTALILGGAAIYGAVKRKPEIAIGAGLGAAYAYSRYRDARRYEDRWDDRWDRRGRSRDRYYGDYGYRRSRYDDYGYRGGYRGDYGYRDRGYGYRRGGRYCD